MQVCVIIEGMHLLDAKTIDDLPGKAKILAKAKQTSNSPLLMINYIHHLARIILFQLPVSSLTVSISDLIIEKNLVIRPLFLFALFFEGLVCFKIARQRNDEDKSIWMKKGGSILARFQLYNEYCEWNFESKCNLLEAECLSVLGKKEADLLYMKSIQAAHEHRFVHEEGKIDTVFSHVMN